MKIILKEPRLAFAQIWEPKAFQAGQTEKFNANFLFSPTDIFVGKLFNNGKNKEGKDNLPTIIKGTAKTIEAAIKLVADDKWKDKASVVLASIKGNPNKFCFRNGDTKSEYDGYAGNLFLGASSKQRPKIIDRDGKTPLTQADGRPYSGCYVSPILDIWAYDNQFGKGISCTLLGMQFVRDGDAFSGGSAASDDDFEDLSGGADAPAIGDTAGEAVGGLV